MTDAARVEPPAEHRGVRWLVERLPVLDLTWPEAMQAKWWSWFDRLWATDAS